MKQNAAVKKQYTPSRSKIHGIHYPEVRLELMLYAELAAAAAFIVALYLLALLPWNYIQRSQLITTRMKPAGVSANRIIEGQADPFINDFVNIHLTARPCEIADWSTMLHHDRDCLDMPTDSDCGCKSNSGFNRLLPRVLYISALQVSKLSYHDMMTYGYLTCCHLDANQTPYCPCGFRYIDGSCFGFSLTNCSTYQRVNFLNNFNVTKSSFKNYLEDNEIEFFCFKGKSYLRYSVCPSDQNDLIFVNKNSERLILCQADLVNPYSWLWMNELRKFEGGRKKHR